MKAYLAIAFCFLATGIYLAATDVGFISLACIGFGLICLSFAGDIYEH